MSNAPAVVQLTQQQKHFRKAFQSSKSVDEMLKCFKQMESCFQESDLGIECWTLAQQLYQKGQDLEKVLSFGKRALQIFLINDDNNIRSFGILSSRIATKNENSGGICTVYHGSSFFIASVCNLLGSACFELLRFDECLSYLNWANRNLTNLLQKDDDTSRCSGNCVLLTLLNCHHDLFLVKAAMGRKEELVLHAKKILEIKEKTLKEGSIGLGHANKMVSDAYFMVAKFEESMPFALKALEVYTKCAVGDDSEELAQVRRNLGTIYGVLGEHEKALELTKSSLNALKNIGFSSEWLSAQMGVANMLIGLGRYEEGIEAFKYLLPLVETEGYHQLKACSFTCMAIGFSKLGKFSDARKHMKIAQRIIAKKEISPMVVATAFGDMSWVYEEMKDYESAVLYLRKALAIPEIPRDYLIDSSTRFFLLFSKYNKEEKGFLYLEEVVDRLKEKLGPEHCQVGYGYHTLGVSYMCSGKLETAAECFLYAKDVMDVSFGPHHVSSLKARQFLAMTYANMKRMDKAIKIQTKVVECLRGQGPSENEFLDAAVKVLNIMKEKVAESITSASPQSKVGEDLSATISKFGISDDGKEVE